MQYHLIRYQHFVADNHNIIQHSVNPFRSPTADGELTIGGTNSDHYTGAVTVVSADPQNQGSFHVDHVEISGDTIKPEGFSAIADTGSTGIFGDTSTILQILQHVPSEVPCDDIHGATVNIILNGTKFPMEAHDYMVPVCIDVLP